MPYLILSCKFYYCLNYLKILTYNYQEILVHTYICETVNLFIDINFIIVIIQFPTCLLKIYLGEDMVFSN